LKITLLVSAWSEVKMPVHEVKEGALAGSDDRDVLLLSCFKHKISRFRISGKRRRGRHGRHFWSMQTSDPFNSRCAATSGRRAHCADDNRNHASHVTVVSTLTPHTRCRARGSVRPSRRRVPPTSHRQRVDAFSLVNGKIGHWADVTQRRRIDARVRRIYARLLLCR
jgi:hypothetical protein